MEVYYISGRLTKWPGVFKESKSVMKEENQEAIDLFDKIVKELYQTAKTLTKKYSGNDKQLKLGLKFVIGEKMGDFYEDLGMRILSSMQDGVK